MRLVIARCSVDYIGRLTAHLPMANRLLLVKADGSGSIHADDRGDKPVNWIRSVDLEVIGAKAYDLPRCVAIAAEARGHMQACLQACGAR